MVYLILTEHFVEWAGNTSEVESQSMEGVSKTKKRSKSRHVARIF